MPSSSSRRSLIVPVSHSGRSHGVSNLYHHLCCGDLRSPISAVPMPTCWAAWHRTEHTTQHLHRSRCSPSPRRNNVETRPVNNLLMVSDCLREMKSVSPTLNQKLGMQGRPAGSQDRLRAKSPVTVSKTESKGKGSRGKLKMPPQVTQEQENQQLHSSHGGPHGLERREPQPQPWGSCRGNVKAAEFHQ